MPGPHKHLKVRAQYKYETFSVSATFVLNLFLSSSKARYERDFLSPEEVSRIQATRRMAERAAF
jgi:hypothetical protein